MKQRLLYLVIILIFIFSVFGTLNYFMNLNNNVVVDEKIDGELEEDMYVVTMKNNKYVLNSEKLQGKKLDGLYYDGKNVYLYYISESAATLLKYNIKAGKVSAIFEDDDSILGGFEKSGKYYRLGNYIYNNSFERIGEMPDVGSSEYLLSGLSRKLLKENDEVVVKNTVDLTSSIVTKDSIDIFTPYGVSDKEDYLLLLKDREDAKKLAIFNIKEEQVGEVDIYDDKYKDTTFSMKKYPYLIFKDVKDEKEKYTFYNVETNEKVYTVNECKQCVFYDTKFIFKDSNNDVKLVDYASKEEKRLFTADSSAILKNLVLADDMFSLVLTTDDDYSFYIFYL